MSCTAVRLLELAALEEVVTEELDEATTELDELDLTDDEVAELLTTELLELVFAEDVATELLELELLLTLDEVATTELLATELLDAAAEHTAPVITGFSAAAPFLSPCTPKLTACPG